MRRLLFTVCPSVVESVISGPVSDYGETGFTHREQQKVTGWRLTMRQFVAIFIKRFHHVRRSKKGFLVEVGYWMYLKKLNRKRDSELSININLSVVCAKMYL